MVKMVTFRLRIFLPQSKKKMMRRINLKRRFIQQTLAKHYSVFSPGLDIEET